MTLMVHVLFTTPAVVVHSGGSVRTIALLLALTCSADPLSSTESLTWML